MTAPRRYAVPALDKALDIIELLATAEAPRSMSEIAQGVGRSVSQVFRTLKVLEERGYLERDGAERYGLTNRLFEAGLRRAPLANLVGCAFPVMAETARRLAQTVHLAVPSHDQMVIVAQADSPGDSGFSVRIGMRRSLAESTSGRVLLAFQDDATQTRWLGWVRRARPRGFDEAALRARLARIRARGFEQAPSPFVAGIVDIGFPVIDARGGAVAAATIPFITRLDGANAIAEAVDALRLAARRIAEAIGSPPAEFAARA